ncbi:hypothetical protein ACI8AF_05980 [Blastococcus sp. SYSU D00669]
MTTFPIPGSTPAVTVVPAPGPGPQQWAGAAAVARDADGSLVLAYRERSGAGDRNVLARSDDGVRLTTVAVLEPARIGAAMVERPALVRTPGGRWRMWVSAATPGTKHWSVALLEAASPEELPGAAPRPAFPGDPATVGVKDPVVRLRDGRWEAWLCCHPLDVPGAEDRMTTAYATSADGLDWTWRGTVLRPTPGSWDARGARVTAVLDDGRVAYDGRPTAEANWFEQTGLAVPAPEGLRPVGTAPAYDARYLTVLPLPGGGTRVWYEFRLPDESHELRTERLPR